MNTFLKENVPLSLAIASHCCAGTSVSVHITIEVLFAKDELSTNITLPSLAADAIRYVFPGTMSADAMPTMSSMSIVSNSFFICGLMYC